MNILALDPATKTGFCSATASGVWDLKVKNYESRGMLLIKFKASLETLIASEHITLVVYEKPGGRSYNGLRSHSNIEGVLMNLCEELKVDYKGYSASEIKRFATGKGNSGKPAMVQACIDTYGFEPIDDNQADAVHLYHLAVSEFQKPG